ncbi:transposase [Streptomyces sp. NPDC048279]|uniref:transposase n=1 Tax=Streptomyces sp. NPDC048279 TaxID=3154714 RepID=UPI003429A1E8
MDHGWVICRHELSDSEWEFVPPLLPRSERGRKRLDDRTVPNGIIWEFRTSTAWRDVPWSASRVSAGASRNASKPPRAKSDLTINRSGTGPHGTGTPCSP